MTVCLQVAACTRCPARPLNKGKLPPSPRKGFSYPHTPLRVVKMPAQGNWQLPTISHRFPPKKLIRNETHTAVSGGAFAAVVRSPTLGSLDGHVAGWLSLDRGRLVYTYVCTTSLGCSSMVERVARPPDLGPTPSTPATSA